MGPRPTTSSSALPGGIIIGPRPTTSSSALLGGIIIGLPPTTSSSSSFPFLLLPGYMVTTATDGGVVYVGTITPQPTSPDPGPLTTYTGYPPEFTWYFTSSSVAHNTHDPQHHPVLPPWPLCFFCPPHLHLGGIVLKLPPGIYPPSIKPPWGFLKPFPRLTIFPDGTPEYPSTEGKPSSSSSTSSTHYIPFLESSIHFMPSSTTSIHGIPSSTRMPSGEPSSTRASSSTSTSTASSSCTKATVTDFWISCAAGSTSCKTTSSSIVSGCSASPTAYTTSGM
ncbi:hypothetical protein LTR74_004207 [Friedmanniomyces endolithicus]|nr:hypothetical protein LTR74_004207 [Friedmanniomyces endolithicus]